MEEDAPLVVKVAVLQERISEAYRMIADLATSVGKINESIRKEVAGRPTWAVATIMSLQLTAIGILAEYIIIHH